jgi:hypothetical protein
MREVTVDLMVPMTVRVDLDTGAVTGDAYLHLDGFQSSPQGRFVQQREGKEAWEVCFRDVFFSEEWAPDEIQSREVCDGEHPLADEAFAIIDKYEAVLGEISVQLKRYD